VNQVKPLLLVVQTRSGEAHTLRSEGLVLAIDEDNIDAVEDTKSVSNDDLDYGTYTFEFDVTAFGEDFYMDEDAAIVDFDILVDGVAVDDPSASSTAALDISGAEDAASADYMIEEGETATFTFTVETATDISGSVKVRINSVAYSADDNTSEELSVDATPADDWTSDSLILN
jgi:hypothetical protein